MVERNLKNLFGLIPKSVPAIDSINEVTREGIPKAFIPYFFYKPPFGYPRYTDLVTIRRLASTPYVEMCINLILDEMSSIEFDIVTDDGVELNEQKQKEIDHIKAFFDNPNTNKESFADIREQYLRDVLEINGGVINKMFNMREEMVEIVARDGATFTKNPDIYGMYTDREDIIKESNIIMSRKEEGMTTVEPGWLTQADVKERAAYFQYGWSTAARPVPFGKRELVWMERRKRTDNLYARGMVEVLANTIQTFIYAIENDLEFFSDNQIPKGVIGLEGANTEEIKAFKEQWTEQQRVKDTDGNWKKKMHSVPIAGKVPTFTAIQFTSQEMELIEKQKWWAKMVWACFGVTGTELGYTEDAKGMANQIVQSSSFKKRTIYPLLRMEEYKLNHEIISEFSRGAKKKEVVKELINGKSQADAEKFANELENQKKLPYQGLKFKFMVFDVEEETKKANLYKLQIDAGIKTVNEIRKDEGLEEVEWGNDNPRQSFGNSFGNGNTGNPEGQEAYRKKKESEPTSRTDQKSVNVETKPFGEYSDFDECVRKNRDKRDPEAYCAELHKKITGEWPGEKAMTTDNPLILGENERPTADRLQRSIVYILNDNEKKIKELIAKEAGRNTLQQIKGEEKSLDDLIKAIKSLILFNGIKPVSDAVIRYAFMSGWEDVEKQLDKNFMVNKDAITFLQSHTFDNIKDMTDELTNDLRAELERGLIAGEGVEKLKDRVNKIFDKGKNRAEMIARTEVNNAENHGKIQAFKSSGERYNKKWLAKIDDRTSEICKRLDGQIVGMNENFKDENTGWEGPCPSAHVNCRSSVVFVRKEEKE